MSQNGMVRPCSCPTSDKLARAPRQRARHACGSRGRPQFLMRINKLLWSECILPNKKCPSIRRNSNVQPGPTFSICFPPFHYDRR